MFCLLIVVLYAFFLAHYIAVVSIVSICLVCGPSFVTSCPSIPPARIAFRSCFIRFALLFVVVLSGEPKHNQGRGLVKRKLVQAPHPPNPPISLLAIPRRLFCYGSFGAFRCGMLLFMFILVIYKYKVGKNSCQISD